MRFKSRRMCKMFWTWHSKVRTTPKRNTDVKDLISKYKLIEIAEE